MVRGIRRRPEHPPRRRRQPRRHLGRSPTRSDLNSARRAANSYARAHNAQTLHVPGRRPDGRKGHFLLLARANVNLDDTDQLYAVATGTAILPTRGRPRGTQGVERLLAAIVKSAHSSRRVDIDHLEPGHALHLADEVADALNDFRRLRDRLRQHGHQPRTTNTPGPAEE